MKYLRFNRKRKFKAAKIQQIADRLIKGWQQWLDLMDFLNPNLYDEIINICYNDAANEYKSLYKGTY
jgi:hypothetical protein